MRQGGVERPAELARRAGPAAWEGREGRGGVGGGRERAEVRGGRACGRWVGGREPRRGASLGGRVPEGGPVARGEGRRRGEEESGGGEASTEEAVHVQGDERDGAVRADARNLAELARGKLRGDHKAEAVQEVGAR